MSKRSLIRSRDKSDHKSLSSLAHEQAMELLRLADHSRNPAIVKIARERQRQQQRLEKNISPFLAVLLATIMVTAAGVACWYVLVNHPNQTGLELVLIITTLAVLIVSLYALFSGHLSQSNFMTVFKWVGDRFRQLNPLGKPRDTPISSIAANDDNDSQSS
jgi:hypothetical protein